MVTSEQVREFIIPKIAEIFLKDADYISANPSLRLREDLHARSMQYFPLINMVEDEFDLSIDPPDFQNECSTIEGTIVYVLRLYQEQHP